MRALSKATIVVIVLLVAGVVLLLDWHLGLFLVGGVLAGYGLRAASVVTRVVVAVVLVLPALAVGAVLILFSGGGLYPGGCAPYFDVREQVDAAYDERRGGWTVSRRFTVPSGSLNAMAAGDTGGCAPVDLGFTASAPPSQRIEALAMRLAPAGWRLSRVENGEPVFERTPEFRPALVSTFPQLKTHLSLAIEPVALSGTAPTGSATGTRETSTGVFLTHAAGSTLAITAPRGMVLATSPPSDPRRVTGGELSRVDLQFAPDVVEIDAASPLARFEPIRTLVDLSRSNLPGFVLGLLALILGAVFKDKIKERLIRVFGGSVKKSQTPANAAGGEPTVAVQKGRGAPSAASTPPPARKRPHRLNRPE